MNAEDVFSLLCEPLGSFATVDSFKEFLHEQVGAMTEEQVNAVFQHIDVNCCGKITFADVSLFLAPSGFTSNAPSGDLDWAVCELQESTPVTKNILTGGGALCNTTVSDPLR